MPTNDTRGLWRGKRFVPSYEWVEGLLTYRDFDPVQSAAEITVESGSGVNYSVNPETLGECTGLRDKNGRLIFEGDIVKIDKATIRGFEGKYGIVEWLSGDAAFALVFGHQWLFFNEHISLDDCEVIGNIHDNPELLKGDNGGQD